MKLKIKKVKITKSYLCHPKEFRLYPIGNGESLKDFKKRNNMVLLVFSSSVEDELQETGKMKKELRLEALRE